MVAGGVQKIDSSSTRVRGESHLLLVGDPGEEEIHLLLQTCRELLAWLIFLSLLRQLYLVGIKAEKKHLQLNGELTHFTMQFNFLQIANLFVWSICNFVNMKFCGCKWCPNTFTMNRFMLYYSRMEITCE